MRLIHHITSVDETLPSSQDDDGPWLVLVRLSAEIKVSDLCVSVLKQLIAHPNYRIHRAMEKIDKRSNNERIINQEQAYHVCVCV